MEMPTQNRMKFRKIKVVFLTIVYIINKITQEEETMERFGSFYLDKEKDVIVTLYMENGELSYVLETPNHRSGNLITNLAKVCHLPISFNEKGLKIIKGVIPCYIVSSNQEVYVFRLGNTKIANIYTDGRIELKATIPAICKTLMSQTKDCKLTEQEVLVKAYILKPCKFKTDLHTHMNANLHPDILIALGVVHQIRYPLYYVKKLGLTLSAEQERAVLRQRNQAIKDMQYELIRMKQELGITFIYVTHDQEEALTMSDTIVVMNQGYIQQIGTPEDIYNEPENAFVADFIGDSNIIDAVMIRDELVSILGAKFACVDTGFGENKPVDVVIRPEDVILTNDPADGTIQGEVTHLIFKGVHYEMEVMANGFEWLVHSTTMSPVGSKVGIKVDPFNIQIMHKPASEDEEAAKIEE